MSAGRAAGISLTTLTSRSPDGDKNANNFNSFGLYEGFGINSYLCEELIHVVLDAGTGPF